MYRSTTSIIVLVWLIFLLFPVLVISQSQSFTIGYEPALSDNNSEQVRKQRSSRRKKITGKPVQKDEKFQSIRDRFVLDSTRIAKKHEQRIRKLEKRKVKKIIEMEEQRHAELKREINKDNLRLKTLIGDLIKVRKLLQENTIRFKENLANLSPEEQIQQEKIQRLLTSYKDDIKNIDEYGLIIWNGINGDSTLSNTVVSARFEALDLLMKYDPYYLENEYVEELAKLEADYQEELKNIKQQNVHSLKDGNDDKQLMTIVRDFIKVQKLLTELKRRSEDDLAYLSPDNQAQRQEILRNIRNYTDHYEDMNIIGSTLLNGISGDSTLSDKVVYARFAALELLEKYDPTLLEQEYFDEVLKVDKIFEKELHRAEERTDLRLKKVHDDEQRKIKEMRDRYLADILPLEKKAKTLQDSLDLIAIRSLSKDEELESLVSLRQELDHKSSELSKTLDDFRKGLPRNVFDLVLLLLHESERALYADSLKSAEEKCQLAIKLAPDYPVSHIRLGSVYYAEGQLDSARASWNRALTLDPSNEELKKFMFLHGLY